MKRYLLDTNHLGEAIRPVSIVRDRIQQLHRQGWVFGTCGPVLCELLVGVVLRGDAARCESGWTVFCKSSGSGPPIWRSRIVTPESITNCRKPDVPYLRLT